MPRKVARRQKEIKIFVDKQFIKVRLTPYGCVDEYNNFYKRLPSGRYVKEDSLNVSGAQKLIQNPVFGDTFEDEDGNTYRYQWGEGGVLKPFLVNKARKFTSLSPSRRSGQGSHDHATKPGR